ncbi:MAG: hypothetical protein HRT35_34180 [Algicola sp.]|nr:hypothetical protein [Algicola sp.]
MIQQKHIDLLIELGTEDVQHEKGSFFDHLKGVAKLLQDWGNGEAVCLAGLFHSIYGTQNFRQQTISYERREKIAAMISDEGENLVYLFCICDRRTFFANFAALATHGPLVIFDEENQKNLSVDRPTLVKLMELEMANLLDQAPVPSQLNETTLAIMKGIAPCLKGVISDNAAAAIADYVALAQSAVAQ